MGKLFSKSKSKNVLHGNSSHTGYRKDVSLSGGHGGGTGGATMCRVRQDEPVHSDAVMCVTHVDAGVCLSGGKDKRLVLYDYKNGQVKQQWTGHDREITKVAYGSRVDSYFSASRDTCINMWHTNSPDPVIQFKGHDLVVTGVALNSDNSQMCSGSRDNSLRLWNVQTGQCLLHNSVTRNLVTHVRWAEDSDIIAQTGEDKELKVWDARSLSVVQTFTRKQHIQNMCDISEDRNYCVTCSNGFQGNGCEATLWDLRSSSILHEFKGHAEGVSGCAFVPKSHHIQRPLVVTCSNDCSVRIWDRDSSASLACVQLPGSGPLTSIAVCDDNRLCVSSFNTGVHVLQMTFPPDGSISLQEVIQY